MIFAMEFVKGVEDVFITKTKNACVDNIFYPTPPSSTTILSSIIPACINLAPKRAGSNNHDPVNQESVLKAMGIIMNFQAVPEKNESLMALNQNGSPTSSRRYVERCTPQEWSYTMIKTRPMDAPIIGYTDDLILLSSPEGLHEVGQQSRKRKLGDNEVNGGESAEPSAKSRKNPGLSMENSLPANRKRHELATERGERTMTSAKRKSSGNPASNDITTVTGEVQEWTSIIASINSAEAHQRHTVESHASRGAMGRTNKSSSSTPEERRWLSGAPGGWWPTNIPQESSDDDSASTGYPQTASLDEEAAEPTSMSGRTTQRLDDGEKAYKKLSIAVWASTGSYPRYEPEHITEAPQHDLTPHGTPTGSPHQALPGLPHGLPARYATADDQHSDNSAPAADIHDTSTIVIHQCDGGDENSRDSGFSSMNNRTEEGPEGRAQNPQVPDRPTTSRSAGFSGEAVAARPHRFRMTRQQRAAHNANWTLEPQQPTMLLQHIQQDCRKKIKKHGLRIWRQKRRDQQAAELQEVQAAIDGLGFAATAKLRSRKRTANSNKNATKRPRVPSSVPQAPSESSECLDPQSEAPATWSSELIVDNQVTTIQFSIEATASEPDRNDTNEQASSTYEFPGHIAVPSTSAAANGAAEQRSSAFSSETPRCITYELSTQDLTQASSQRLDLMTLLDDVPAMQGSLAIESTRDSPQSPFDMPSLATLEDLAEDLDFPRTPGTPAHLTERDRTVYPPSSSYSAPTFSAEILQQAIFDDSAPIRMRIRRVPPPTNDDAENETTSAEIEANASM
ncbi:hypothetical protein QAD02_007630 [Eretmocerus hayati]|uniref:Uncharacterized protein n=1 Tax=Eretmocerus hayati TaxID=131215 RepID=A0ACC2N4W2_9HYME|nr:hypothetical protein QAD02_007630 [Eretmocerus hayati]